MPTKVQVGHGTTIAFADTAFEADVEFQSMNLSGMAREPIDKTHLSSPAGTSGKMGGREFIASPIANPGQLACTIHANSDKPLPINEAPEQITITFPLAPGESTAATWVFTGFVVDASLAIETEEIIGGDITIQISGEITVTAGAP